MVALEAMVDEQNDLHLNTWLGIHAKVHGCTIQEEQQSLEEHRMHLVDAIIKEINTFHLDNADVSQALNQIQAMLCHLFIYYIPISNLSILTNPMPQKLSSYKTY